MADAPSHVASSEEAPPVSSLTLPMHPAPPWLAGVTPEMKLEGPLQQWQAWGYLVTLILGFLV